MCHLVTRDFLRWQRTKALPLFTSLLDAHTMSPLDRKKDSPSSHWEINKRRALHVAKLLLWGGCLIGGVEHSTSRSPNLEYAFKSAVDLSNVRQHPLHQSYGRTPLHWKYTPGCMLQSFHVESFYARSIRRSVFMRHAGFTLPGQDPRLSNYVSTRCTRTPGIVQVSGKCGQELRICRVFRFLLWDSIPSLGQRDIYGQWAHHLVCKTFKAG